MRHALLPFLLLLACGGSSSDDDGAMQTHDETQATTGDEMPAETEAADIVDTAVAAGSFDTLVAAVQAAGLEETLRGEGPFTVFAPTNDAFAALPEGTVENLLQPDSRDQLVQILTMHVVSGDVRAADVVGMSAAPTLEGTELPVTADGGTVTVGGATVVQTDIEASNGVIHVIDAVILPAEG